jgi:hypothetical protein
LVEHTVPGIEATISVPGDWIVLTVDDLEGGAFDQARKDYPHAAATIDDAETEMRDGESKLIAFEPESEATDMGFITHLTIVHVPGAPPSAEEIAQQIGTSVEQELDVVDEVEAGTATVAAGQVALVTYVLAGQGDAGVDAWVTQFAYPRQNDGFIVTLAAPNELLDSYSDTWQRIADSVAY